MARSKTIFYNLIFSFFISLLIINADYFNGLAFLIINFSFCLYVIFHYRQIEFDVFRNSMIYFSIVFFIYGLNNPTLLGFNLWIFILCGISLKLQALHCISQGVVKKILRFINLLMISDLILMFYLAVYTALKGLRYTLLTLVFIANSLIYHYLFRVMTIKKVLRKRIRRFSIASYIYYYFTGYIVLMSHISLNYVVSIAFLISSVLFVFRSTTNQMHTIFGVSNFIMFIAYAIYNSMYPSILVFHAICACIMLKYHVKSGIPGYLYGFVTACSSSIIFTLVYQFNNGIAEIFYGLILLSAILLFSSIMFQKFDGFQNSVRSLRMVYLYVSIITVICSCFFTGMPDYTVMVISITILSFADWRNFGLSEFRYWFLFASLWFFKGILDMSTPGNVNIYMLLFLVCGMIYFVLASRLTGETMKNMTQMATVLFINLALYSAYKSSGLQYFPYVQLIMNMVILILLNNIEIRLLSSPESLIMAFFHSLDKYILHLVIILMTEVLYFNDQNLLVFHLVQMMIMLTFGMYPLLKKIIRKEL